MNEPPNDPFLWLMFLPLLFIVMSICLAVAFSG